MTNANDLKIIEKVLNDPAMEMSSHELEDILENELNKPAEEIDPKLIDDLMESLQPEAFSAAQQQKIWKNIQKKLAPKPNRRHLIRRLTAVAALLVLLTGFALTPANAFNWRFLRKLMQPVAETFGIYLNYFDDDPAETPAAHQYGISEDETTPVMLYDLSELPDTYEGYTVKPGWVPAGFAFVHALSYSEVHMQKFVFNYLREEQTLSITISILTDPKAVAYYEYERLTDIPEEKLVGSKLISFYQNFDADTNVRHASLVDADAHYSIRGIISAEEMEQLVMWYAERLSE